MDIENIIKNVEDLPLSLTVSDVSKALRIGRNNAYELCNSENFPSVKIGNRIIVPKPAFEEWLKNPKQFERKM